MGIIMAPIPWPEKHIQTAHAAPGRRKPILIRKEVLLFLGAFFAVQMKEYPEVNGSGNETGGK